MLTTPVVWRESRTWCRLNIWTSKTKISPGGVWEDLNAATESVQFHSNYGSILVSYLVFEIWPRNGQWTTDGPTSETKVYLARKAGQQISAAKLARLTWRAARGRGRPSGLCRCIRDSRRPIRILCSKHNKYVQQPIIITSSIDEHKTAEVCYFALTTAKEVLFLVSCVCVCVSVSKTSSSAIAERARDASCLSVVTFNSTTLDGYILWNVLIIFRTWP